jgi:inhibitor of KinA sporulation pathway (predicted exonuclease)
LELTGITQAMVDGGNNFPSTLKDHREWLIKNVENNNVIIITCGHWDLGTVMISECKKWNIIPPKTYQRYINLGDIYKDMYKENGRGMANMLRLQNIKLDGRHHSGLDDSRNIAKIFQKIISDGYKLDETFVVVKDAILYKIAHENSKKELDNKAKRLARLAAN